MNEQGINEQYRQVVSLLEAKRLKEAQTQLEGTLCTPANYELHTRLEEAQNAYHYMLLYLRQGANDPEREKLYHHLLVETWEIADQARIALLDEVSKHFYHELRKKQYLFPKSLTIGSMRKILEQFPDDMAVCQLTPDNHQAMEEACMRHESTNRALFLTTWGNSAWSAEEEMQSYDLVESPQLPVTDGCLFTSAVTLSLMECFDARKIGILIHASECATLAEVRQRALVGLAIALHIHPTRLSLYPKLTEQLARLGNDTGFCKMLNGIYLQLLKAIDTEKVVKRMREEIIPDLMKRSHRMEDAEEEPEEEDNEELKQHLIEMDELKREGADVNLTSFTHLKNFPFFKQPQNWFYPFDPNHSEVCKLFTKENKTMQSFIAQLFEGGMLCNSDEYSLALVFMQFSSSQHKEVMNYLPEEELTKLLDTQGFEKLRKSAPQQETLSNLYIQDLYRFFKLNPRRAEHRDIFSEEIALHRIEALKPVLYKPQLLLSVANLLFSKEKYGQSLAVYKELLALNGADAELYQHIGFCQQKEHRYREAVTAYQHADLLQPEQPGVIRHLATCYRKLKDYASALEYYKKVEELQPDNKQVLYFIGECHMALNQYEEALRYLFRLDLMDSNSPKVWRGIGWCSLASGKHAQALKYLDKLLEETNTPSLDDWFNAGHAAWVNGYMEKAVAHYAKAAELCEDREQFIALFENDKKMLIRQGIPEAEIPLMPDAIYLE